MSDLRSWQIRKTSDVPGRCDVEGPQTGDAAVTVVALEDVQEVLADYSDHQAWRCEHPDRYPWDPDCRCGLVSTLAQFGLTVSPNIRSRQ